MSARWDREFAIRLGRDFKLQVDILQLPKMPVLEK